MEGTHKPINIPASFSPLNHKYSEKIKDKKADTSISVSDSVNFLNILVFSFSNVELCNVELFIGILQQFNLFKKTTHKLWCIKKTVYK